MFVEQANVSHLTALASVDIDAEMIALHDNLITLPGCGKLGCRR